MRTYLLLALIAALALLAAATAAAKDFEPADLRVCNADRCLALTNRDALEALSGFYYGGACAPAALKDGACTEDERTPPAHVAAVPVGAPAFQLRYRNGYVTGIVAGASLDRFLSYGVHVGWFARGRWYRVPARAAQELRRLTAGLTPMRVTRAALAKSR
ncbi:MAG TPA: hypothetical protein VJT84_11810 [Gaiellaceae bacterium]|nr:hypothetical protein [Gaiellaceae bacterium]